MARLEEIPHDELSIACAGEDFIVIGYIKIESVKSGKWWGGDRYLPPYAHAMSVLAQSTLRLLPSQWFFEDSILNAGRVACFGSTVEVC